MKGGKIFGERVYLDDPDTGLRPISGIETDGDPVFAARILEKNGDKTSVSELTINYDRDGDAIVTTRPRSPIDRPFRKA